jgi:anti-sigma-K factor RskA
MAHEPSKMKSTLTSLAAEVGLLPAAEARRRETKASTDQDLAVAGEERENHTPASPPRDMAREAAEHEVAIREARSGERQRADGNVPGAATKLPPD